MTTRTILTTLLLATTLPGLAGCGESTPVAGGNVTLRDMEVVDGTANDSMTDLDNATDDGTLLSNVGAYDASALPAVGTERAATGNSPDDAAVAPKETGNTGTAE